MLVPYAPSWPIISATSSRFTTPSLSLSRIWNASRSVRTCAGWSWESALPLADCTLVGSGRGDLRCAGEPRRGDLGGIVAVVVLVVLVFSCP